MDDLIISQPDSSWAQLFLPVDRLNRKGLLALRRIGMSYQILLMNHTLVFGEDQYHEEPSVSHR
jgi:hypothetical protein